MILSDGTVPWLPRSNTRLLSKSLRQRQDLCHYLNGVQVHPGDIRNILPFLNLSHGSWCLAAAAALGCIPADAAPPVCSASPSPLPNSLLPVLSTPDSQQSRPRCSVSIACVAGLSRAGAFDRSTKPATVPAVGHAGARVCLAMHPYSQTSAGMSGTHLQGSLARPLSFIAHVFMPCFADRAAVVSSPARLHQLWQPGVFTKAGALETSYPSIACTIVCCYVRGDTSCSILP